MSMTILMIAGLGVFSGILNTMAGGASLLTLPALMSVGLSVDLANGTNRVGLLSLSIFASWQFFRAGDLEIKPVFIWYLLSMIIGSLFGTYAALTLNPEWFRVIAAGVILLMLMISLFGQDMFPDRWVQTLKSQMVWCFFIGFYAGWIHAGVGILLMIFFMLQGFDLRKTNAFKTFLISIFTLPTSFIYIYQGYIDWNYCMALILGGAVGSWIGVKFFAGKYIRASKALMAGSTLFAVWKMVQPVL